MYAMQSYSAITGALNSRGPGRTERDVYHTGLQSSWEERRGDDAEQFSLVCAFHTGSCCLYLSRHLVSSPSLSYYELELIHLNR